MNLRQIIIALSLLSPSFLCMGMEQSNDLYAKNQQTVNELALFIQNMIIDGHCSGICNYEYPIENTDSKVLKIVAKREQRIQNNQQIKKSKRPDKPLFTPSYRTSETYSRPAQKTESKKHLRPKNNLPPTNQEIIYISSDDEDTININTKEIIEID